MKISLQFPVGIVDTMFLEQRSQKPAVELSQILDTGVLY